MRVNEILVIGTAMGLILCGCGEDYVPDAMAPPPGETLHVDPGPSGPSSCWPSDETLPEDVTTPTTVVGDGTPESCTGARFVEAVAGGGVIVFDCGPESVTITLTETAKVVNATGRPRVVIDGGDRVTLSGGGRVRILYQNTCDEAQGWTTAQCQDQDHPRLTVQNITFADGDATGETAEGGGGGAIFVRGGRFKAINARFIRNQCDEVGPDVGGGAIRILSQHQGLPAYIIDSEFGGAPGLGNRCANGGALSSIGVSMTILNSRFSHNEAIGHGANPARQGSPGGGSGGAIYNDGNTFHLSLCDSTLEQNTAREGGGAIFFVSNDRSGTLTLYQSTLRDNPSEGFETSGYPGIFALASGDPEVIDTTIE